MKLLPILMLSIMIFAGTAVAAENKDKHKGQNFEQAKSRIMQGVDARLEILNKFKACVGKTKDHAGLKACKKDRQEAMHALKIKSRKDRGEMKKNMKEPK